MCHVIVFSVIVMVYSVNLVAIVFEVSCFRFKCQCNGFEGHRVMWKFVDISVFVVVIINSSPKVKALRVHYEKPFVCGLETLFERQGL